MNNVSENKPGTTRKRPNILLITADQMRWDVMGCIGNPLIQTPNLDALAARGMLFRNGFTPNPICVPARASIMTGNTAPVCTGSKNNGGCIRDGQPLLPEVLKSAGYRTYALGKLHFVPYAAPDEPRLVHGLEHVEWTESGRILGKYDPAGKLSGIEDYFDYLKSVGYAGYTRAHGIGNNDIHPCRSPLPPEHTVDHWVADRTLAQLQRHQQEFPEQPFFIWMSTPKPHSPYDPPDPYDKLYDPRHMPPPFGYDSDLKPRFANDDEMLADRNPQIQKNQLSHYQDMLSPEARQVSRAYYYGLVTWMDKMIGRVLDQLEKDGLRDNTLVLFTADHGDLLGDFGGWFKTNHLNGSVRVPFIAAGPDVKPGIVSDALVGLEDILPTFAAAAGADISQKVQGLDLTPVLNDSLQSVRSRYYSSTLEGAGSSAMICDGEWKYIYSAGNATEELYNQLQDPQELHNLAALPEYQARREQMRAELIRQATASRDTTLLTEDGELIKAEIDRQKLLSERPSLPLGWRWY